MSQSAANRVDRGPLQGWASKVALAAPAVGAAACVWLLLIGRGSAPSVGCGAGNGCGELLSSPASRLLGVPLPALGLAYFAMIGGALIARRPQLSSVRIAIAAGVGAGSSLWLIALMARVDRWCPICLLVHAANLLLIVALVGVVRSHRGDSQQGLVRRRPVWAFGGTLLATGLIWLVLHGGGGDPIEAPLSAAELEILAQSGTGDLFFVNSGGAEVDLFIDPTCEECNRMLQMLAQLTGDGRAELTVRLHLFPLESECNLAVPPGSTNAEEHRGACRLSNYGRMIGFAAPERFLEFHDVVHAGESRDRLKSATAWMEARFGPEQDWPATLRAEAENQLEADINLAIDLGISQVPTLIVSGRKYTGCPDRVETLATILGAASASGTEPLEAGSNH